MPAGPFATIGADGTVFGIEKNPVQECQFVVDERFEKNLDVVLYYSTRA